MHAIYYYPPPVKTQRFRPLTAFLALCVSLVLVQSTLSNTIARTRPELPGCVMLAAIPHRRLPGESPVRAVGVAEAVCPNTVTTAGFTLIELSIVLVIIGLIVGGVLVGQNLIASAAVRAQVTQIEKYQQAVNTFKGKYGYLPGDMPDPYATQFNFVHPRGAYAGGGDGNGLIEGAACSGACNYGNLPFSGEEATFWVDLSTAQLIDGSFSKATPTAFMSASLTQTQVGQYLPQAKINSGGYVYVWSGGWQEFNSHVSPGDSYNYFGLSAVTGSYGNFPAEMPLLTVAQAYAIDKKIDDGLPQSGSVSAMYVWNEWAAGGPSNSQTPPAESNYGDMSDTSGPVTLVSDIGITVEGPNSCYDGRSVSAAPGILPEQYSIQINKGAGVNCVLSFRFQ